MVNVIYFATIEVLCGFAPNFTVFFILRMLFGIGMGVPMIATASMSLAGVRREDTGAASGQRTAGPGSTSTSSRNQEGACSRVDNTVPSTRFGSAQYRDHRQSSKD